MFLKHLTRLVLLSICLLTLAGCKETYTFNPSEINKVTAQETGTNDGAVELSEKRIALFVKAVKEAKKITEGTSSAIGSSDELIITEKNGQTTELEVFYLDTFTTFLDGEFQYKTTGESAKQLIEVWKERGLQK
ncbi:hypothetical protein [Paenibacillus lutrae]|uniref:DUF1307 domain-containing protein n=1 Tax=Paenibacillus lutrae TaxID=2078573 RepID=A0A7X3FEI8_9BACL|nr:hypothetical protein [Paenibacillus lutrae]MVO98038.1 hypothetical protein [Paenibacillus lutrae]